MTQKLDLARLSISNAIRAYRRSDIVQATRNYTHALLDYLSHSVLSFDVEHGIAFLAAERIAEVLETTISSYRQLHSAIGAGRASGATAGNCYQLIALAHMAQLLCRQDLADSLVKLADHDDVRNLSTPFWDEYWRAMDSLCAHRIYTLTYGRKLKGQERYWIVYLRIIEAATTSGELAACIAEAESLFQLRNRDRTVRDDGNEIEGSAWKPVKWDFRLEALKLSLTHR